ncbi:RING1 and YY1-binding protein [Carlito syrichta]|uniref:RING1 and YY1-binding protein n=1 Tax=Carlito syrichta TaxID=1868482 RepID=A0A3Q0DL19_CARSF|nr:RING1 and YY1-binding protein [Carlito syrichta]
MEVHNRKERSREGLATLTWPHGSLLLFPLPAPSRRQLRLRPGKLLILAKHCCSGRPSRAPGKGRGSEEEATDGSAGSGLAGSELRHTLSARFRRASGASLGRGFGPESRPEAGASREADTKLRVAEEPKGAREVGQRRPCRLAGHRKPRGATGGAAVASPRGARKLLQSPKRVGGWSPERSFQRWIPAKLRRLTSACVLLSLPLFPAPCLFPPVSPHSPRPRRPKRQAKPAADEGFWDCSVCTFRNSAEAFKCSICDVRKGTSTRKPRINSQLVAQQVAQQYATPPPPKKEKKEKVEKQDKEKPEKDKEISPSVTKKNTNKKTKPKSDILKDPPSEANSIQSANATTKTSETNHTSRPRLKNVDRSTAQQLAVTVGNVTVIITDFKEKTRSSSTSSSTVTSSAGSEQQNQSSSGSESTDKGSSRSSTPKGDMSAVNDESF